MKKLFTLAAGCAVTLIALSSCKKETYNLQYNLENGKTYTQSVQSKNEVTQEMGGQKQTMSSTLDLGISYSVVDTANQIFTMDASFSLLSMTMDIPQQGKVTFSSEESSEEVKAMFPFDISGVLKASTTQPFTLAINKQGRVEQLSGMDVVFSHATQAVEADELLRSQAVGFLNQMFGEDRFRDVSGESLIVFPDHAVSVGYKWEATSSRSAASVGFPFEYKTMYELKEVKDGKALIEGDVVMDIQDKTVEVMGMPATLNLKGDGKQSFMIDLATGWITTGKVTHDFKGTFAFQDMSIPMEVKGETTISGL